MLLKYTPEGGEAQTWTVDLGKLRTMETEAIEKVTDLPYGSAFREQLFKGGTRARRALLWTMLRRAHPTLKFADVDFADDEVVVDFDREEWANIRAAVADAPGLDDDARAFQLGAIDAAMAEAPEAPGKAPASSSGSATGSPSPSSSTSAPGTSGG